MTQDIVTGTPGFGIGRVLAVGFRVTIRNFVPFFAIAVVLYIPSFLLAHWAQSIPLRRPFTLFSERNFALLAAYLVAIAAAALVRSAVIYGALQDIRGEKPDLPACIARGMPKAPKVFVATILWWIAIIAGFCLLLVPGLVLLTMFWVCTPAIVAEDAGIIGCFRRSRTLTKGHRWGIFGLFLILGLVFWGWEIVPMSTLGVAGFAALFSSGWPYWGAVALSVVVSVYTAAATAVGYYLLRGEKEGIAVDRAAAVFD